MERTLPPELLQKFEELIESEFGIAFYRGKLEDLERAVPDIAAALGKTDLELCLRELLAAPLDERQRDVLASRLTVGETYFFRNREIFEAIDTHILPSLLSQQEREVKIWSAACASGEEPYSLAMLVDRKMPRLGGPKVSILGTDVSPAAIAKAKRGIYREWSFRDVGQEIRSRYFEKRPGGDYAISERLRSMVELSLLNLTGSQYPSPQNRTSEIDLLLCRNVLMYFNDSVQRQVLTRLASCVREGGWLILSPNEAPPLGLAGLTLELVHGAVLFRVHREPVAEKARVPVEFAAPQDLIDIPVQEDQTLSADEKVTPSAPAEDLLQTAQHLYEAGEYEELLTLSLRHADAFRKNPALDALLARALSNSGSPEQALHWARLAIEANKLHPPYYYLCASILQELGKVQDAIRYLERALYLDHGFIMAHIAMGSLKSRLNKKEEAWRSFLNAGELLDRYRPDEIVPDSEGMTASALQEIVKATVSSRSASTGGAS